MASFRDAGGDILVTAAADADDLFAGETLMLEIAGELDAMNETVMKAARRIAIADMEERFATQTDPDGDPWASLDPEYLRRKRAAGKPDSILIRDDRMHKAAVDPLAWNIVDNTLFFDPSVLPTDEDGIIYGLLHQEGTGDEENRGLQARIAAGGYTKAQEAELAELTIGRGLALPARPWIGMSEVAEASLWELFNKWFEAVGETSTKPYIHPGGQVQSRSGGKFGPLL